MAKLIFYDPYIRVPQPKSAIVHLPPELRPYEFKKEAAPALGAPETQPISAPQEQLTGYVHGKKASKLEERFALALDFFGMEYIFQYEVDSAYNLPSDAKVIDFIVFDGGLGIPIEIGARFTHGTDSQAQEDQNRQQELNAILPNLGLLPLGLPEYEVELDHPTDFEDAKTIVSELFINA